MRSYNGVLIVFEGGEGAGKTTISELIYSHLKQRKLPVVKTREPGGCELGEQVRELVLCQSRYDLSARAELLLFLAARAQHVHEVILPALQKGNIVLCDRFHDSTIVYQGIGRNLGVNSVKEMSSWAANGVDADLTFYLDVSPQVAAQRLHKRNYSDRIEAEGEIFHQRIREGFLQLASKKRSDQSVILNGERSLEENCRHSLEIIDSFLEIFY